jgi:hypothetical protein
MKSRTPLVVTAVVTVALWIVGLIIGGLGSDVSDKASDAQVLAWVQKNTNTIVVGAWIFMLGCVGLLFFVGMLRERLATAEGGNHLFANIAFAGGIAAAVLGVGTNTDIVTGIDKDSTSPAAAAAFHHLGDLFFMGAEVMLIPFVAATALVAWRTAVLPRWWAVFGLIVAVVLAIGPIGWAALIFGTPIWLIGTSLLVGRRPRRSTAPAPATA